ncbi:MAG: TorD/DmsD family molecular chaperone [Planctomycetales bacterium]|jgi:TorA maturation chaperone TorD
MPTDISDNFQRTSVYRLLARLWAEEPGGLLAELAAEPLSSAWQQLGGVIPDHESEEVRSTLDEDYCRLFVGPKEHLPPIQSVWEGGELDTAVTTSLREFDSIIGFELPWSFAVIDDHLGNELWAMGQILSKTDGLPPDQVSVADDLARVFFTGHLSWAERLLDAVVSRESVQFYGTLATITQQFLSDEAVRLGIAADQKQVETKQAETGIVR